MKVKIGKHLRYRIAKVLSPGSRALRCIVNSHPTKGFRAILFHDVPRNQIDAFDYLLRYVIEVHGIIAPGEAEAFLAGHDLSTRNGRTPCLVTFDDGFSSQVSVAKEILDYHGVKAVFFVCPGLIDVPRDGQREAIANHIFDGAVYSSDLPREMSLLSWSDLEALVAYGHTIGSHTSHHRRLSKLTGDELQEEIIGSAELLRSRLGIVIKWFAHPFGDFNSINRASFEMINRCYDVCCSGIRGLNSGTTHPLGLRREYIDLTNPFGYQKFILNGGLDFYWQVRAWQLQGLVKAGTKHS